MLKFLAFDELKKDDHTVSYLQISNDVQVMDLKKNYEHLLGETKERLSRPEPPKGTEDGIHRLLGTAHTIMLLTKERSYGVNGLSYLGDWYMKAKEPVNAMMCFYAAMNASKKALCDSVSLVKKITASEEAALAEIISSSSILPHGSLINAHIKKLRNDRNVSNCADYMARIRKDREEIASLRTWVKAKTNAGWLGSEIRTVCHHIEKKINTFLERVFAESELVLGTPPCAYETIGFGSYARGGMTPYSDLEFGILMDEFTEESEKCETAKCYFRQLSTLVQMRVIGLGESRIRGSRTTMDALDDYFKGIRKVGFYFDPTVKGLTFDPGGKTPLGHHHQSDESESGYELICTPKEMAELVRTRVTEYEEQLPDIDEERLLGIVLCNSKKMFRRGKLSSAEGLADAFHRHRKAVLLQESLGKDRALWLLRKNITLFKPDPREDVDGKTYEVKKDIYRFPGMVLEELALFFSLAPGDSYEQIMALKESEMIAKKDAEDIERLCDISAEIRLRAYQEHLAQSEPMGIFAVSIEDENVLPSAPETQLFDYYYRAIPLYEVVKAFVSDIYHKSEHLKRRLFDDGVKNKALICKRLLKYDRASRYFQAYLNERPDDEDMAIYYSNIMNFLSIEECERFFESNVNKHDGDNLQTVSSERRLRFLLKKAMFKKRQEKYDDAKELLDIFMKGVEEEGTGVIDIGTLRQAFSLKGILARIRGDYDDAIKHFEKMKELGPHPFSEKWVGDESQLDNISVIEHNLAQTCMEKANHMISIGDLAYLMVVDKAIGHSHASLSFKKEQYRSEVNVACANSHIMLGNCYRMKGDANKAIAHNKKAVAIAEVVKNHYLQVVSYYNLAQLYFRLNHEDQVRYNAQKVLSICEKTGENTAFKGNAYYLLGTVLMNKQQYENAIQTFRNALDYFTTSDGRIVGANAERTFEQLLICLHDRTNSEILVSEYKKYCKGFKTLEDSTSLYLGKALYYVGSAFKDISDYDDALKVLHTAKRIFDKVQKPYDVYPEIEETIFLTTFYGLKKRLNFPVDISYFEHSDEAGIALIENAFIMPEGVGRYLLLKAAYLVFKVIDTPDSLCENVLKLMDHSRESIFAKATTSLDLKTVSVSAVITERDSDVPENVSISAMYMLTKQGHPKMVAVDI